MKNIKVKLYNQSQIISCTVPEEIDFQLGDKIIVLVSDRLEFGEILCQKSCHQENLENKIVRKATPEDLTKLEKIEKDKNEANQIFEQKAKDNNLEMKLIKSEISFDEKYITFYFSAETRLDFRSLLKDLVRVFHKMIRLQQVGPRDEAKLMSGFGPCGRELCCQKFLNRLESVPSNLAKLQSLSQISSSKISGACGKLMCCLSYEVGTYQELIKELPKVGDKIETNQGEGRVVELDVINQKVKVELASGKLIRLLIKK